MAFALTGAKADERETLLGMLDADPYSQINTIQMQLLDLAKAKTAALAAARHINLQALEPSINRLAKAK